MGTVLLVDAGNTNTKICLADDAGLGESYTLPTRPANTDDDWGIKVEAILAREGVEPRSVEACVISSVVPPLDPLFMRMARRFLDCEAVFAGRDLTIDLINEYARPEQTGADILVGCLAARLTYDAANLIVIDFGTATTLACVMGNAFKGGLICPGVLSSRSALASNTAKLPNVDLRVETDTLTWGRSTEECLNQGLVFGFASMIDGLVAKLSARMDDPFVVATGGLSRTIAQVAVSIDELRPDLVMEGLWMAYYNR
ncbi:MAG: type III pantothenate kinase [Pseudodesulfovibrio sp.]|uniref:Type III pantothenate kinase n=2 Tax=Desulfovibrionaceae TaxID=194924 RepID=E6VXR2_PSEA9|nr:MULTISPECIES: type III pantothenate kinase [Pseudodesulfovibrio]MBU4193354.1 type III pantothenate kinase [Pseudomonadota bacterium]MBV1739736.1 type III pantothenate kinase [Desulfarculus sp.]ADU61520.1 transcriptional activator, Baf family [Pseudodesulfovibrio aespoeensis Aspo-2]MBU4243670.1 type III pantothenate kinase [Pseudomonadota bacterium]MBU4379078.1 type III pantothenate kinase [Pseudomonadota bacterium]